MLAHSKTIRDVSRALPALVSDPDLDVPIYADLLDAYATGLNERFNTLMPVIDRAGSTLAEAVKAHDPDENADPEGEGVLALEQAELHFKHRREELLRLRDAFADVGASPSHKVFDAVDRLDNLYVWIVGTMQQVRWSMMIFDGVNDAAKSPEARTYTSASEWLASFNAAAYPVAVGPHYQA